MNEEQTIFRGSPSVLTKFGSIFVTALIAAAAVAGVFLLQQPLLWILAGLALLYILGAVFVVKAERYEATTERIRRLNRVYAVLSHINHAIVRERDQTALLTRACRIAVEQGGFAAAWIGLAPQRPGAALTIAADAGDAGHGAELRRIVRRLDAKEGS